MSMETWERSGIGLEIEDADPAKLADYMTKHGTYMLNKYTEEEWFSTIETIRIADDYSEASDIFETKLPNVDESLASWLGYTLGRMHGSNMIDGAIGCGDTDVYANVLYRQGYPWELSPRDAQLTIEDVFKIMRDFAEDIGSDPDFVDDQCYQYCG